MSDKNTATRIVDLLSGISRWVAGVALVLMTLVISWQVYARYILNDSPSWSEGTALLLMGWFILIGAAAGVRHGDHLGFTVGLMMAPPRLRVAMRTVTYLLMCIFGLLMALNGFELVRGTWAGNIPGMILPQGVDYIPLVVGGILIAVFSAERLVQVYTRTEEN